MMMLSVLRRQSGLTTFWCYLIYTAFLALAFVSDLVLGVNVVADLLALVTVDTILLPFNVALDEVAEKAVQLDARVIGTGQAATTEAARRHREVASVLLDE